MPDSMTWVCIWCLLVTRIFVLVLLIFILPRMVSISASVLLSFSSFSASTAISSASHSISTFSLCTYTHAWFFLPFSYFVQCPLIIYVEQESGTTLTACVQPPQITTDILFLYKLQITVYPCILFLSVLKPRTAPSTRHCQRHFNINKSNVGVLTFHQSFFYNYS